MLRGTQARGIHYREIVRKPSEKNKYSVTYKNISYSSKVTIKNTSVEVNFMTVISKVTGLFSM